MGDHDEKPEQAVATGYKNAAPPTTTTTAYKNPTQDTTAGLTTTTRSGEPFTGMFDGPPSQYKNATTTTAPAAPPPTGGMQWIPPEQAAAQYKNAESTKSAYGVESKPFVPTPAFQPVPLAEQMKTDKKLKGMKSEYVGEDKDATKWRGSVANHQELIDDEMDNAPKLTAVTTRYMNETEAAATKMGVKDGKLLDANGKALDTTAATGTGTYNQEGENKHIFTMTGGGEIRQADPWAAKQISTTGNLGLVNHTSFTAGKAVAGAGEIRAEKGQLQEISDQSGHYRPDGTMLGQTIDQMNAMGVNMDMASVKMVGKQAGQAPVFASPAQFQQHDAATAETEIRDEKAKLKDALFTKVGERNARLGHEDSDAMKEHAKLKAEKAAPAVSNGGYKNSDAALEAARKAAQPATTSEPDTAAGPSKYLNVDSPKSKYLNTASK